jgi:hypothetical protein
MEDHLSDVLGIADAVSVQTQAHERLNRSLATALMRISQMEIDICHQTEEIAAV